MILTYVTLKSSTPYDRTVTDFNRNANDRKGSRQCYTWTDVVCTIIIATIEHTIQPHNPMKYIGEEKRQRDVQSRLQS